MRTTTLHDERSAPDAEPSGRQREALLGEWIGASLGRFFEITGQHAAPDAARDGVTVLATQVEPSRRAAAPANAAPRRATVTIVTWRVCPHDGDDLTAIARAVR